MCDAGKYSNAGRTSCISCPSGQTTLQQESESASDCFTPTCSSGEYLSGFSCFAVSATALFLAFSSADEEKPLHAVRSRPIPTCLVAHLYSLHHLRRGQVRRQ